MRHNAASYSTKIFLKIAWDFLYFPLWWYSSGFKKNVILAINFLSTKEASLGFSVWLKNIFVPMYGQTDFSGRLISFLIRFVQIIYRGLVLLFVLVTCFIFLLAYLLLPLAIILAIFLQIT